jgi:cell division protein FtsW
VGSGGLLGLGLGQTDKNTVSAEEHNDYIFSIICEELAFRGLRYTAALCRINYKGVWLAMHCRTDTAPCGHSIMILLTLQVFLNVAVATNLMPSKVFRCPFSATAAPP